MKEQETAEQVLESKTPPTLYKTGKCYVGHAVDAMQEYSDQQNAELRERVKELEGALSDSLDKVSKGLYFLAGATLEKALKK